MTTRKEIREFGDFQTPDSLAVDVCTLLRDQGIAPTSIIEPSCGRGSFISAATRAFPNASLLGIDINPHHLAHSKSRLAPELDRGQVRLQEGDFFKINWSSLLGDQAGPLMILGNPPWVTSAELGTLESTNLPRKVNVHGHSGIDALMGKSNFDISEWMLLRYLDWLKKRGGWIAVLVKTAVARKILVSAWKNTYPIKHAAIYPIDAMKYFGAAVDASLFLLEVQPGAATRECCVYGSLGDPTPSHSFGFHDGTLIANVDAYLHWRHLAGKDPNYTWRSGIKHDCSKVMELTAVNGRYRNGLDEAVEIEDTLLYPLLKSSDVNKNGTWRNRFMLVTQMAPGAPTDSIRAEAPRTWEYLQQHRELLGKRSSSIYRGRPSFSIFGVGDYSFSPWKVAISGFYKSLRFIPVGPSAGRPTVFDDTVYFLSCQSEEEARFLADLLNSSPAQEFYESMVFWADKRPITIDLLKRLKLASVAAETGQLVAYELLSTYHHKGPPQPNQLSLIESS